MQEQHQKIHRDFDGHLEKELKNMTAREKLESLWKIIELKNHLRRYAKKTGESQGNETL